MILYVASLCLYTSFGPSNDAALFVVEWKYLH
jgi:hypothetical protein